jgi:hypothetical protein
MSPILKSYIDGAARRRQAVSVTLVEGMTSCLIIRNAWFGLNARDGWRLPGFYPGNQKEESKSARIFAKMNMPASMGYALGGSESLAAF